MNAFAWTIHHKGIDWPCRTEQDALGVLCYLRDYGRDPLGAVTITPEPTATLAAAAFMVVYLTPPDKLRARRRDAESMLGRLIRANARRAEELGHDIAAGQREATTDGGPLRDFAGVYRRVVETMPIPQAYIDRGVVTADHYRKCLLASTLQDGFVELFAKALGEAGADHVTAMLATIAAAGVVVAGAYDTNQHDDDGFAELLVEEFRGTLLRTIAYWREKKAN